MGPQADGGSGPWTKGDSVAGDRSLEAPGPRRGAGSGPRSRGRLAGTQPHREVGPHEGVRGRVTVSERGTFSAGVSPPDQPPAPGPRGPRGSILPSTLERPARAPEPHRTAALPRTRTLGGTGSSAPTPGRKTPVSAHRVRRAELYQGQAWARDRQPSSDISLS